MVQKLKPIAAYKKTLKVDRLPLKINLFLFYTAFSTGKKKKKMYISPKNKCPTSCGEENPESNLTH